MHRYIYIYLFIYLFIYIPKFGLITGFSKTSCLLSLSSWLSNIISCYVLAATILAFEHYFSWLSNIAPYTVFVAAPLLTFKYAFLLHVCCYTLGFPTQLPVFCCCALDFQTPTMVLLLRSGVSNETSDYVSAARLLSFHHKLALLCLLLQCSRLSRITSCWLLLRFWLSINTSYYVFAATLLAFQHNFPFVVASVLALKYYFLVRSCCYALGFPT